MFKRLRSKLQPRRRLNVFRLRLSESILPSGYYTQMLPVYADVANWKSETSNYHRLHDWPDVPGQEWSARAQAPSKRRRRIARETARKFQRQRLLVCE